MCAALAGTLLSLAAAAPAAPDRDQYGNSLSFWPGGCNPSQVTLSVAVSSPTVAPLPLFLNGVAWLDYYGIPIAVSPPLQAQPVLIRGWGMVWPWPSPSAIPSGRYTLHVLLQGNGGLLDFLFTTVSTTATVDPALNPDCTPKAAAASTVRSTRKPPSAPVLARRVHSARRNAESWSKAGLGPHAQYPKARVCGSTVCVKDRAGAAWTPVSRR